MLNSYLNGTRHEIKKKGDAAMAASAPTSLILEETIASLRQALGAEMDSLRVERAVISLFFPG